MPPSDTSDQFPVSSAIQTPTPRQQSWGTIISLVIILAMIVVGAFYAWGKRIAEEQPTASPTSSTTLTY